MSALFTEFLGETVQTGTGKVDPAPKFKCTTAARDCGLFLTKAHLILVNQKLAGQTLIETAPIKLLHELEVIHLDNAGFPS